VTQAEAGVASRREAVIMARKNVNEKENALKRLITNDIYALRDINIVPTDTPVAAPVILDPEESIRHGLANRPDYRDMKIEVEKKDITVQYARNQEFPNIDLEASYGFNGLADSFGDSLREMDDNPQWTLGVVMKFPIGNRAAGGDLRAARLEAKKSLLNLKKLEQEILVEIDNAIRELDMNKQRMEVTKISTKLARESLRAEEIKLKAGLSTSHNVLEFHRKTLQRRGPVK
jgi:outer membrane protein TolC